MRLDMLLALFGFLLILWVLLRSLAASIPHPEYAIDDKLEWLVEPCDVLQSSMEQNWESGGPFRVSFECFLPGEYGRFHAGDQMPLIKARLVRPFKDARPLKEHRLS